MNYELIAFDMDGTLLDTHKHVLPSSTEAIDEATAAGKTVAICSGRCPKMVELDQASFGNVRYAICCNGSVIYDLHDHRVISTSSLDHEVIVRAAKALGSEDALIDIFQGRGFFCQPSHIDRMPRYGLGIYQNMYRQTVSPVDDIRKKLLDPTESYQKIIFHFASPEARERVHELVRSLPVELAYSEMASLEFSPKGVDKGSGLLALADLLGIPHEATIAVGDADNDLPMLHAAGLAVAMGNANENVLAASDVVVSDNDHDGCAETVHRFLLGGEEVSHS